MRLNFVFSFAGYELNEHFQWINLSLNIKGKALAASILTRNTNIYVWFSRKCISKSQTPLVNQKCIDLTAIKRFQTDLQLLLNVHTSPVVKDRGKLKSYIMISNSYRIDLWKRIILKKHRSCDIGYML